MAFIHDIFRTGPGKYDMVECEHTIQDCVDQGWIDPETGLWTREFVEASDYVKKRRVANNYEAPDRTPFSLHGKRALPEGMKLVQASDGRWVADVGGGLLFK